MDTDKTEYLFEDVKRLKLKPSEILVLKFARLYPQEEVAIIHKVLYELFPNNKILMLPPDIEIGVISPTP